MRLHGDRAPTTLLKGKDGRSALFTGGNNEVWIFGEETYEILVKYMNLRKLMKQAHEKGTPISDILVAPIVHEEQYAREVYLPSGAAWTNMRDGKIFDGGQTILIDAPLEIISAFIRGNMHKDLVGKI